MSSLVTTSAITAQKLNSQAPFQTALDLCELGLSIIPMYSQQGGNGKAASEKWKDYQKEKAPTKEDIIRWQQEHRPVMWAALTGGHKGRITLDFDGEAGHALVKRLGLNPHRKSGSGGFQQDFTHPGWYVKSQSWKSTKAEWAEKYKGLDIKGDKGVTVVAGSNRNGRYTWLRDPIPDDLSLLPEELRADLGLLQPPARRPRGTRKNSGASHQRFLVIALSAALADGRNNAGFKLACTLRRHGFPYPQAEEIMREYQQRVPTTDSHGVESAYTLDEALASLESAYRQKTEIILGRQLSAEIQDILDCLAQGNNPPEIFVRGGLLTRLSTDEKKRPHLELMNKTMVLAKIVESADYFKYDEKKDAYRNAHPSEKHAGLIHSLGSWPFPPVTGITELPVVRSDGTILGTPGFDPASCLIYAPQDGLNVPKIPEHPTQADARQAAVEAFKYIAEFPFVSDADLANMCALLLTVVIRMLCPLVPLALIDAPKPGTGKTLLFGVLGMLLTGRYVGTTTAPTTEEEWGKTLTSLLLKGTLHAFCLDNITSTLNSGKLASFLTTQVWSERVLGGNVMPELENMTIPCATGNNLMLGGDIPRRCYRIVIDADMSQPWKRAHFTYHPLLDHIAQNRGEIIAALLTMVRAWYKAGQPQPEKQASFQDLYAEWARIAGGVLAYAGIEGFLGNSEALYEETDSEGTQWAAWLTRWYELFSSTVLSVSNLKKELETHTEDFASLLPDSLHVLFESAGSKGKSFSTSLGMQLRKRKNTPFGPNNLRLIPVKNAEGRTAWKVAPQRPTPSTPFTPSPAPDKKNGKFDGTPDQGASHAASQDKAEKNNKIGGARESNQQADLPKITEKNIWGGGTAGQEEPADVPNLAEKIQTVRDAASEEGIPGDVPKNTNFFSPAKKGAEGVEGVGLEEKNGHTLYQPFIGDVIRVEIDGKMREGMMVADIQKRTVVVRCYRDDEHKSFEQHNLTFEEIARASIQKPAPRPSTDPPTGMIQPMSIPKSPLVF